MGIFECEVAFTFLHKLNHMEQRIEKFWHRVYFKLELGYINACIERAYRDLCRTLRLSDYEEGQWDIFQSELSEILKRQIEQMLSTKMVSQEEFDNWHQRTIFQLVVKGSVENIHEKKTYLTVGQAQKWINMTLKYVYAVGERHIENAWANHTYYHVPIDSIIQDKLSRHGVTKLEMPWSQLDEMDRYFRFQKECRSAFPRETLIDVEMDLFNEQPQAG